MGSKYLKTVDLHMFVDPDVYVKMREKADELDMGVSTWARMTLIKALRDELPNSARSAPGDNLHKEVPDIEPPR